MGQDFQNKICKFVAYLKNCLIHKVENDTIMNEAVACKIRLEGESFYAYIPKWITCDYVFFRLNLLRIMDTKYAIIIKNCEKPNAETNATAPEPGLAYVRIYDYRHNSTKVDA